MPGLFDSYIYGQEKRHAMCMSPVFEKAEDMIYRENILPSGKTGDCIFMLRKLAEGSSEIPSFLQWEDLYFSSGKHRLELLKKNGKRPTYQLEEYYGRTQEELFNLSMDTYSEIRTKIPMTPQAWLNVIYIMVIDKPYRELMRIVNTTKNLVSLYNGKYEFDLADPITVREQGTDLFLYSVSTKELEGGIKILPGRWKQKLLSPDFQSTRTELEEKHELFRQTYDTKVFLVFSETDGRIVSRPPI